MARILMGWEMGNGLGHIAQLKSIGEALEAAGHELVYVLRHRHGVRELFSPRKVDARLAPRWIANIKFGDKEFVTATVADIMGFSGFRDVETIGGIMRGWDRRFAEIKPDLIVGDTGPALWLAARDRIPTIAIGMGMLMPPSHLSAMPCLVDGTPSKYDQVQMVDAVNTVQRARGGPTIESLPEMFRGDATFVLNLPILDPYRADRLRPPDGPLGGLPEYAEMPDEPFVFIYLAHDQPTVEAFYRGLRASGLPSVMFLRGASDERVSSLCDGHLRVVNQPLPMVETLTKSRLVVHYGGFNTVTSALAIGRPQMVIPVALERKLSAQRVQELGVGFWLDGTGNPSRFARFLTGMVKDADLIKRTQRIAKEIAEGTYPNQIPRIAAACEALLAK